MKKWKCVSLLALVFALVPVFAGCLASSPLRRVSSRLGIDAERGRIVSQSEDHGGFHGDGTTFLEIGFPDDTFAEEVRADAAWKPLPLSENLSAFLYGAQKEHTVIGPYITGQDGAPLMPPVENGAYRFIDRHGDSTDPADDSELFHRASFNVTLAVYDFDADMLYFIEFDT